METFIEAIRYIHKCLGEVLAKYDAENSEPKPEEPVEVEPEPSGTPYERFIRAIADNESIPETVKPAIVAQSIIESARGESELAKATMNFTGKMYRDDVDVSFPLDKHYYKPTNRVEAGAYYLKYRTPEESAIGDWAFIQRSVYDGWQNHTESAVDFISFLKSKGYAADPDYVAKITRVLPEAYELLGLEAPEVEMPQGSGRLALVIGHTKADKGALAGSPLNMQEYTYNMDIAERAKAYAKTKGVEVEIFTRDSGGVSGAYDRVEAWKADAANELHFNAASSSARGTEILLATDNDKPRVDELRFAQECLNQMYKVFDRTGSQKRGLRYRPKSVGERGYFNVNQVFDIPSVLVEPFFGSNQADAKLAVDRKQEYAQCLVDAFITWKG